MKSGLCGNLKILAALSFGIASVFCIGPGSASAQVSVQFQYGTRTRPLQGRRFETMRALAHYLDERAQQVLSDASATQYRGSRQRRYFSDISEFARRANHFHERMDHYLDSPYDLPGEVLALERRAQAVNARIRDARVFRRTYADWDGVLDVLNRMKQVLAGYDVQVPPAHRALRDYDQDYAPFQGGEYPNDPLARQHEPYGGQRPDMFVGSNLPELRRLASQLDDLATQAHEMAEQGMVENSWGSQNFTETLHHFNQDTRALRQQSEAGQVDRRSMADAVNHLLADAQQINGRFGEVNSSGQLRNQWGQVMSVLNRMAQLLQQ